MSSRLFRPLLSLIKRGHTWTSLGKIRGLNPEQRIEFQNRLYSEGSVEASGVPSLFAHPFVFYTKLRIGDEETFEKFSTLIKGVFLGIIKLRNLTGKLGQLENIVKKVKSNFIGSAVLEWKNFPIGGLYPDCFVFPGAKFEAKEYGDDISWIGLKSDVQRMESQLGSDIVRALYRRWMDEINGKWEERIKKILNLSTAASLPQGIQRSLWLQKLSQIAHQWSTTVQAPATALDEYTTEVCKAYVIADDKNLEEIPIRSAKRNIFCEKIIKFANGKMPDLPIKSEYLNLINKAGKEGNAYWIELNGWQGRIEWTPQETVNAEKASIMLWPNFKAPGWNINYAFLYPSPVFRGLNSSLSLINFDDKIRISIGELKERPGREDIIPGCSTKKAITHIEAFCNNAPVGIFFDNRPIISEGAGNRRVSIDFGTAHTCLSVWDGQVNTVLTLKDMSVDILEMDFYNKETYKNFPAWLPTFEGPRRVLPSELIFPAEEAMRSENLSKPIERFTVPPYPCAVGISSTAAWFKWHEPPKFAGCRGDLVKEYLKMVMHIALANLRKFQNTQSVDLVPTYPLAFDNKRYLDYKTWLDEIIATIQNETGMHIELEETTIRDKKELIGESYAAKALSRPTPPATGFVVDIGGGTTDIALFRGNDILAVDSIRYGGNIFLEYLIDHYPPRTNNPDIAFINDNCSVLALQRALRILGSMRNIFELYPSDKQTGAEAALLRFFNGLFEYLRTLLFANNLKDNIFLYPIGNGWKLIEGFKNVPNIKSFIEDWFKGQGIHLTVDQSTIKYGLKEDLAFGANEIIEQKAYAPPEDLHNRPVQTFNPGAPVKVKWKKGSRDVQPYEPIPTSALGCTLEDNPEFDTGKFVKSLPFRPQSNISLEVIANRLNAECKKGMFGVTARGMSLIRSVLAKFLEQIYPKHYL